MVLHPPTRTRKPSEDGFILLAVLILLALFVIAMAAAMPKIAADIQRDRDVETMHRGKQYVRAIQLYYRKFHAYPPSLDALDKTNDIRFVRKKYIDPITGKNDWKIIHMCQNKTPMAMGFFGQPLGSPGCSAAGGGAGVMGGLPGQGGTGVAGQGGSGIFNNTGGSGGGIFSNPPTGSTPTTGTGTGTTGAPGAGTGGDQSSSGGTDANGNPTQGQTFGGGGVVGVSPASPKQSIYVYKKKNHYNEWEFLYSPLQEMQQMGAGGAGTGLGQPGTGVGQPGSGVFGGQNPSTFGPGGNGGSTPIQPTPPPAPNPQ